jgi:hypothetical protein
MSIALIVGASFRADAPVVTMDEEAVRVLLSPLVPGKCARCVYRISDSKTLLTPGSTLTVLHQAEIHPSSPAHEVLVESEVRHVGK